jgi:heme-degrading monooxygenase HmoA
MMIARIWKGAVRKQDGDAYARYMQETGVAGYAKSPGNNGVWMLRRDVDDRTEFVMFTLWDSLEAVKAFAGDDHETAVFYLRTSGSWSSATSPPPTTRSTLRSDPTWPDRNAPLDAQARLPVFRKGFGLQVGGGLWSWGRRCRRSRSGPQPSGPLATCS